MALFAGLLASCDQGTDESLLTKLHGSHGVSGGSAYYLRPRVANGKFGIKHYAGEVFYDIKGFVEKNRDNFREELSEVPLSGVFTSPFFFLLAQKKKKNPAAGAHEQPERLFV